MGRTWRKRKMKKQKPTSKLCVNFSYAALLKWLKSNGFECMKLKPIEFNDTGRGLMALSNIPSAQCIVSLPERLLITTKTVLSSDLGSYMKRCVPCLSPVQVLCIYLIYEQQKGMDSFWYPYIQVLPDDFTTPVYYSNIELECLPTRTKQAAEEQIRTVSGLYQESKHFISNISEICPELAESFTYEKFKWAWCVVNTRSVYMKHSKNEFLSNEIDHYALAPFLDLLNHSVDAKVDAGYNPIKQCYEIVTWTPYSKYQQVFINYGPHSNTRLLIEYGFMLPSNIHNSVQFDLDQIKTNPMFSNVSNANEKLKFIKENDLPRDLTCVMEGISWNLIKTLQILCSTSQSSNEWKRILYEDSTDMTPTVKKFAASLLRCTIEQYHSKDDHSCTSNELSFNQKMCASLCLQEERLLKQTLNTLQSS